jgi:hypothetical protein
MDGARCSMGRVAVRAAGERSCGIYCAAGVVGMRCALLLLARSLETIRDGFFVDEEELSNRKHGD